VYLPLATVDGKLILDPTAVDALLLLLVELVVLLADCLDGPAAATVKITFFISLAVSLMLLLDPLGVDKSGKLSSHGNMIVVEVTSSERSLFC